MLVYIMKLQKHPYIFMYITSVASKERKQVACIQVKQNIWDYFGWFLPALIKLSDTQ